MAILNSPTLSIVFFLLTFIFSSTSANDPCTAMDSGEYPSVPPRLFINVDEANEQDLKKGGNQYLNEIRLYGTYGAETPNGIELSFSNDYRTINPQEYFEFQLENSSPFRNIIRLIKPIDRDGVSDSLLDDTIMDNFRLKCVPYNQTSTFWYDVSLLIRDVNDNIPILDENNVYNATVNELIPVGSSLPIKILATDKDAGENRKITFKILTDDEGSKGHLSINNETGEVVLQKPFDFEALSVANGKLHIPFIVYDNGKSVQRTSEGSLTIEVTDGDDQGPQFRNPPCEKAFGGKCFAPTYNAQVENVIENSAILFQSSEGGKLMEIKAKDGDTMNEKIQFKISAVLPNEHKSAFELKTISPKDTEDEGYYTASLKLIKPIDKSALAGTVVFVMATEDTPRRLYSIARVLFQERKLPGTKEEKTENVYGSETLALIVVVAILSAVVLFGICLLIVSRRKRNSMNSHMINGHVNEGMRDF